VNETVPDDGTPAVLNGEPGAVSTDSLSDPLQDSYSGAAQLSTSGASSLLTDANNAAANLSASESEFSDAALQLSPSQDLVAMILPPAAVDATGKPVPAGLSVNGDTVTLNLQPSASTTYPVLADPETDVCANINPCQASTTTGPNTQWMVDYALKWFSGRNGRFVAFKGDDCTNFMSQILAAGGMFYQDYGSPNPDAWWVGYGFSPQSAMGEQRAAWHWSDSWSVAADFIYYMLRYHFAERITGDNWKAGDMIGYIWHNMPKQIDHVNFVSATYVNGQGEVEPMVTQHSPNQNITTHQFLADSMAKQPDGSEEYPFQIIHIRFIRTAPLAPGN
jgi:Putative amidase domain